MRTKKEVPPGYKHSALGFIPLDWETNKLYNIVNKPIVYGIVQAGPEIEDGVPYIKSADVGEKINVARLSKTSTTIAHKYRRSEVQPGDIVFSLRGNIGELSIIPSELKSANLTQGTARISVDITSYDNQFIAYSLRSGQVVRNITFSSKGSTFKEISLEELRNIELPTPILPEQNAIAKLLSTWDKAIETTTTLIAQKELRKKWLMQQLLTGERRLKGYTGKWKKYAYDDLLKIVKRPVEWNDNELYNLLSVRRRSGGAFARESLYGHQILVKDLRTAKAGDFLFSKMQILHGASALVTDQFDGYKISGSYIAVVANDSMILSMEFLNWYSKMPYFYHQTYISSYGVHIEKMTFDFETFLTLDISLPPIEEQKAITKILETSDKEIQLLRQKLDQLREQKKGLMQVLLTGKKRLKI